MKTIHVICTVQISDDKYSELLNSNSSVSVSSIVHQLLVDGELSKVTFSNPLIQIPLPPKVSS